MCYRAGCNRVVARNRREERGCRVDGAGQGSACELVDVDHYGI